jgi:hypothetical protein
VAGATYPLADEEQLHVSLGPAPLPPAQNDDDDVDALDCTPVLNGASVCTQWYYSADHEASGGRDAGAIYLGGVPAPVILPAAHLGLPPGVDLADFEFVWTPTTDGSEFLTLLFAVHGDDPLTPANESGGLDARMIYASYLTGFSFPFLATPLSDAVDGIAACCEPIGGRRILIGDVNCDGMVDFGDINPFVLLLSNPVAWQGAFPGCPLVNGDINGDGAVNFGDINPFVALLSGS